MSENLENYSRELQYVNILKNKFGELSNLPSEVKKKRKSLLSRLINNKSKISKRNKVEILEEVFDTGNDLKDHYMGLIKSSKDQFSSNHYLPNNSPVNKFDEVLSHPIYHHFFNAFETDLEKSIQSLNDIKLSKKLFNLVILRMIYLGIIQLKEGSLERVVPSIEILNINKTTISQKLRVQKIINAFSKAPQNQSGLNSRLILINSDKIKEIKDKIPLFTDKLFDRFYKSSGSELNILITFNRCSN
ncbi:hypothetical protein N9N67_06245 [Bacteriovoracaceae bacterium]|nr:hypothetical protein [Bacteriovoracaceae bacterium]